MDKVGAALIELVSFFASPQRDQTLLDEAGVSLDRALFPLLMRLARGGPKAVAALAEEVGRDHTTVSRQLAKLESLGLIERPGGEADRRRRTAAVTPAGMTMVEALVSARRRLLAQVFEGWSEADLAALASLNARAAASLRKAAA